ncbi:uncharacterized protein PHALS_14533 [Plasmopara halstedii]|uniref:Uncharacterized protein n=1 Tax=Plasmopara halstedii TaxID=4781 RepID=A0A0P1AKP0_PLAHL|nr:uncharacterized protein PHALS_14533 [Plasmopara halstedii]CEG41447.1 hypothetical protein PHALS_14533 [Plasmopara halstedii]|eukprot:XP_024577816.1 hypothetical protein PHALS_14533 [Plasmopara halstedii]
MGYDLDEDESLANRKSTETTWNLRLELRLRRTILESRTARKSVMVISSKHTRFLRPTTDKSPYCLSVIRFILLLRYSIRCKLSLQQNLPALVLIDTMLTTSQIILTFIAY